MDIQLLLFILWLVFIIIGVCFDVAKDHGVALVFYILSLACMVIRLVIHYNTVPQEPSDAEVYEQKLQEIDKAEKDLKKFLIDHPEFKDIEQEKEDK